LYEVTRFLVYGGDCTPTLSEKAANMIRGLFSCDFRAIKDGMNEVKWGMKGRKVKRFNL
jgi:hypothetical protein